MTKTVNFEVKYRKLYSHAEWYSIRMTKGSGKSKPNKFKPELEVNVPHILCKINNSYEYDKTKFVIFLFIVEIVDYWSDKNVNLEKF